ncbi:hypothetical protein DMUE_1566 [Dictyocoela muelleri]|nr:hypothetical protein DMUE_1566 [Dictyocoela muelleri]
MFDTGIEEPDRVIVFSTYSNIIHLSYNKTWICDGTFRSSPCGFYQIYTIMAIINCKSFPLTYLIMKKKLQAAYSKALNFLKSKLQSYPENIIIDFESTALRAITDVYPQTRVEGCFFHFSQLLWRKIQQLHLSIIYKKESEFRMCVKMILSLAFINNNDVFKLIDELDYYFKNHYFHEKIDLLWSWFKNLNLKNNNSFNIFLIDFWSVNKRLINLDPMTTNSIEGWHRGLNMNIRIAHPSIKEIGLELLREQRKVNFNIVKNLYTQNADSSITERNKSIKLILESGKININHLRAIAGLIDLKTNN